MHVRRLLLVAIVAACAPLAAAHACSCAWGSTRNALEMADAVFLGQPIAFRPSLLEPMRGEVTRFRVARTWKGDVGTEAAVVSWHWSSCDVTFPDDGTWFVVFAERDAWGRLTTWGCSGTAMVGDSAWIHYDDSSLPDSVLDWGHRTIRELGPGSLPVGPPAPDPWPEIATWGTACVAVVAAWGVARRRRTVAA